MIHKKIAYYYDDEGFEFIFEPIEETISIEKTEDGFEARYLTRDEISENPDEWGDTGVFLVNYHRDFWVEKDEIITKDEARDFYQGKTIEAEKNYFIFPLTSYIHSGVILYLGNHANPTGQGYGHWDTSHIGLVLISKKEAESQEKAKKIAEGLIQTWNSYLSGDVYGCVMETYDDEKNPSDHDSVWGFYGFEYAKKELNHCF